MTNKDNEDLKRQAMDNTLGLNPVIGIRGKDILSAARTVMTQAIKQPFLSAKHVAHFSLELKNVVLGQSPMEPDAGDRRFADPTWSQNPLYKRYMQTYLAWSKELHEWIDDSKLSAEDISRGHFVIKLVTDAMAPTNTMANPAAVKRFFETGGKSLLDGLSHLAKDMVNNGGMPSQVNMSVFEVGKSLATTEGAVVFRNDVLELIQYKPVTEQVHERPLLVVPPQINKFYVFDLSPEKSVARFCVRNNLQTFVVSWRNPTKAQREWGLSTYIEALKEAIEVVCSITGSSDINMLGACSGGMTTASLLGHYAALGETKVHALTLLVSVLDNRLETEVALFADEKSLEAAKRRSYQAGVLEGADLAKVFAWMRPNDLIWNYWVNNYLMGKEPPAFDILYWNNDNTRLPAALHGDILDFFKLNPLKYVGGLEVCGTPVDLQKVTVDSFSVAGVNDHITPWAAVYRSAQLLGGKQRFLLSNSGHIQSILNPPSNPKANYYEGSHLNGNANEWHADANNLHGSWWPTWLEWVQKRSGEQRPTLSTLGNQHYPPQEKAPGTYVHMR